jgi:hypothetical protein
MQKMNANSSGVILLINILYYSLSELTAGFNYKKLPNCLWILSKCKWRVFDDLLCEYWVLEENPAKISYTPNILDLLAFN